MALGFQKYRLTVTFVDTGGIKIKRSFVVTAPNDTLIRQYCANFIGDMKVCTNMAVSGYEIALIFVESALALPVDADGKEVLFVSAPLAGNARKRGYFSLPAPKDICFYGATGENSNTPNFTNASLLTWIKGFATLGNGGWGSVSLADGETILLTDLQGERQHRKG